MRGTLPFSSAGLVEGTVCSTRKVGVDGQPPETQPQLTWVHMCPCVCLTVSFKEWFESSPGSR